MASDTPSPACAGKTDWDFFNCQAEKGAALEFDVDGESTTMSIGDYLAAVNAQGAQRIRDEDQKKKAAAKKDAQTKKYLMYLAAGGAGILLLRSL